MNMLQPMANISCLFTHNPNSTYGNQTEVWTVPLDGTFNGPYLKCLHLNPIFSTPIVHKFDNYGRDIYWGTEISITWKLGFSMDIWVPCVNKEVMELAGVMDTDNNRKYCCCCTVGDTRISNPADTLNHLLYHLANVNGRLSQTTPMCSV